MSIHLFGPDSSYLSPVRENASKRILGSRLDFGNSPMIQKKNLSVLFAGLGDSDDEHHNGSTSIDNSFRTVDLSTSSIRGESVEASPSKRAKVDDQAALVNSVALPNIGLELDSSYWPEKVLTQRPYIDGFGPHLSKFNKENKHLDFETYSNKLQAFIAQNPISFPIDNRVDYYSAEERKQFKATLIRNDNGAIVLTNSEGQPIVNKKKMLFVLNLLGELFVKPREKLKEKSLNSRVHHSSFMCGEMVRSAGRLTTNELGEVVSFTDDSGHYKPGKVSNAYFIKFLAEHGMDLTNVRFSRPDRSNPVVDSDDEPELDVTAREFLELYETIK